MAGFPRGERQVVWLLWATYGSFYFCRANIAAAVPGLEHDLSLSKAQIGAILGGLKLAYGVGQFINGQLAERARPRLLLALGMFGSAALNAVFGLGTGMYFLLFVWAANGYFQALGWTPCMRVAANWFPSTRRGRAIGIIGTGYQLTGALTFVIAGWSAETFGWRGAHLVPAVLLALFGVMTLVLLREAPEGVARGPGAPASRSAWRETLAVTVANPRLWLIALALAAVDATRYGFMDWGVSHLMEVQGETIGKSALKYAVLPLGGACGAYFAGWASDRFFAGRRVPVLFAMLVLLGSLAAVYDPLVRTNPTAAIVVLGAIGFAIFGPQVLLVGSAAMDVARADRPAAAVGFVNLFGYLGAFSGDQVTGLLAQKSGWGAVVYFWAACGFAAALVLLPLWRFAAVTDGSSK